MPSKSRKQAKLMAAAAHNPKFAKKVGIPGKVAQEFNQADAASGILKGIKPKINKQGTGKKRGIYKPRKSK